MITANAVLLSDAPVDLSSVGIDTVPFQQAEAYLSNSNPSVIGAHCHPDNFEAIGKLLQLERQKNSSKRFIIFYDQLSAEQLTQLNNTLAPQQVLPFAPDTSFQKPFEESFDSYYQREQAKQLQDLVKDKNEELKKLTISLERKVADRQEQLESSRQKNLVAEKRLQILKKTLVQIYRASSLHEIEHGVTHILAKEMDVAQVKIRRPSQSNLMDNQGGVKFYETELKSGAFGNILFFNSENKSFPAKEKRFLNQVAEAVSLSIERTFQYLKSQELKKQWEATFDAISDPICLTDENYNIIRINANFLKKTGKKSFRAHLGKKCYQELFGRTSPCEGCQRGQIFQIRNPSQNRQSEVFDVYSNTLEMSGTPVYFQMYRDVTQDLNLQRQVIETAKMAELGTISSSIAHELNNPIGGMLNFVQLMKMDLTGDEDFYDDILEIEKGIIKCKNIVKNLLGFSRRSFNAEISDVDLSEIIEQAIKITELKTRSIGIKINFQKPTNPILIQGRFNLLTHAVRNILQNSQESLIEKRKTDRHFQGQINIQLKETSEQLEILFEDNGGGLLEGTKEKVFDPLFTTKDPETNSGLGLTLALQIVKEHNGTIEISTSKDKKLQVKVCFFKSEVQSGPSAF